MKRLFIVLLASLLLTNTAASESLKLAVTTSFHNSGLSNVLLPEFAQDTGLEVKLIVVGTGQALRLGVAGDVDAILVHSRRAEEAFVTAGNGTHRREIMYNDFVIIGPSSDPAQAADATLAAGALARIARAKMPFVSRGDDSGTHKRELSLWALAGVGTAQRTPDWYKEVGAGMGAALNTASGLNAYALADRASWLNFGNKGSLKLLFSGDSTLFNQYAFIPVNPAKHPHVKRAEALQLEAWLTGLHAKKLINAYTINGEQLFTFNAQPTD